MSLIDDLEDGAAPAEVARRRFLAVVGAGALGAGTLGATVATLRFVEPTVIYEEDQRIAVGRPEEIAPGTALVLARGKVFVVRTDAGFIAFSTVCTHLGCLVRPDAETGGFACPCHGSRFHAHGSVRQGPAPKPLRRLALSVERGLLVVDAGKVVEPDAVLRVPA